MAINLWPAPKNRYVAFVNEVSSSDSGSSHRVPLYAVMAAFYANGKS